MHDMNVKIIILYVSA